MSTTLVAKSAGVSVATVSRVINNPASVAPETVALVKRTMVKLNYSPPSPGQRRGPKPERTERPVSVRVGLWCIGTAEAQVRAYFSSQLETLHFALGEANLELKLLFSPPSEVPSELLDGSLAGFLLQGLEPSPEALAQIASRPHVWIMTRRTEAYPGDYVEPDNGANGRIAAEWMHRQKVRRWAFLTTEPDYPAFAQRRIAFVERAKQLGQVPAEILGPLQAGTHHLTLRPGDEVMDALARQFCALTPHPDGVYLPGDGSCGAFFRALRRLGREPRTLKTIIGHYSPQVYDSLDPQPVAINVNVRAIIRCAVQQLSDRIRNPGLADQPVGIRVAPFLRVQA